MTYQRNAIVNSGPANLGVAQAEIEELEYELARNGTIDLESALVYFKSGEQVWVDDIWLQGTSTQDGPGLGNVQTLFHDVQEIRIEVVGDVHVIVDGGLGVATSIQRIIASRSGRPLDVMCCVTDVWRLENSRWKIVEKHAYTSTYAVGEPSYLTVGETRIS